MISGNGNHSIWMSGTGCDNNIVQGNYLGVTANGAAKLTTGSGITIQGGAKHNLIGGTASGARNVIVNSGTESSAIRIRQAGTEFNVV